MAYNDANRLESITENSQVIAGYTYNAAGQRKTKVTPAGTTIYHYDLGGNLISETTSAGSAIKDYIWQGNEPIAQIDVASTEQITYLHTDHLMTARLGTNTGGTITWRWESDAFGQTAPEEDVDGNTINTSVNLRFPGQYYDAETNLHYNWNRYYDPELGRYITSDPIGLSGGSNTYLYALANPIKFVDDNGAMPCLPDDHLCRRGIPGPNDVPTAINPNDFNPTSQRQACINRCSISIQALPCNVFRVGAVGVGTSGGGFIGALAGNPVAGAAVGGVMGGLVGSRVCGDLYEEFCEEQCSNECDL